MRNNKPIIVPSHTDNKNMERYLHKKLSEVGEGGGGGGGGQGNDPNAVHFTQQSLTEAQKEQARTNIGAGTYSKPQTGIPASDMAVGVIPDVSGKEDKTKKVSTFQATPDDTHYPTEKLLYDSLPVALSQQEIDTIWNNAQ